MNVLSLFDGISCGQIALNRANIKYNNYYASEVDKHAIKITQENYPNTIQLGDVRKIKTKHLKDVGLLLGGSPCQGFSFAGKELNFKDSRSVLFFEFVKVLDAIKPKYFILENVLMQKQYQDVISSFLGVEPLIINSLSVSPQKRVRLYWTNIPYVHTTPKKHKLNDILEVSGLGARRVGRRILNGKRADNRLDIPIIQRVELNKDTATSNCLTTVRKDNIIINGNKERYLTPIECERLQTVPDNYTSAASDSQRCRALGNSWTVDVIVKILCGIENKTTEDN